MNNKDKYTLDEIWKQIESSAGQWRDNWNLPVPVIPLHVLKSHWNHISANQDLASAASYRLKLEHQNALLQQEVHYLKHKLDQATGAVNLTPFGVHRRSGNRQQRS